MTKREVNVIITDDDPVSILLHKRAVIRGGLATDPLVFSNAIETLSYLDASRFVNRDSLILLDINMPEMSGWELLDEIVKKDLPGTHVIIVSSSVNTEDYQKAESHPLVMCYIEKPLTLGKVQQFINSDFYKNLFTT